MQKLFDLKLRAKATETCVSGVCSIGGVDPNLRKDPSEIVASVAASVAAGTSGPGSTSFQKPSLLEIPGGGHSSKGPFLNLPSPNVQGQDSSKIFKKLSGQLTGDESEVEEVTQEPEEPPDPSVLHRRQALVPPKLITDEYESAVEDVEGSSTSNRTSPNLLVSITSFVLRYEILMSPLPL